MKTILRFIGTDILGGLLFLAPIVVFVVILNKAFDLARRGLKPLEALIPDNATSGPTASAILALLMLMVICFLAGLSARTVLARRVPRPRPPRQAIKAKSLAVFARHL